MKTGSRIKIILILVISFSLVSLFSQKIFLANTPRIHLVLIEELKKLPRTIAQLPLIFGNNRQDNQKTKVTEELPKSTFSFEQTPEKIQQALSKIPLRTIAKGVYAGEDKKNNIVYFKMTSETEYKVEQLTTADGRVITVYIPKEK